MFLQICWFVGNVIHTNKESDAQFATRIAQETNIINCLEIVLKNNSYLKEEVVEKISWIVAKLACIRNLPEY